jgi:hypothetical protein
VRIAHVVRHVVRYVVRNIPKIDIVRAKADYGQHELEDEHGPAAHSTQEKERFHSINPVSALNLRTIDYSLPPAESWHRAADLQL